MAELSFLRQDEKLGPPKKRKFQIRTVPQRPFLRRAPRAMLESGHLPPLTGGAMFLRHWPVLVSLLALGVLPGNAQVQQSHRRSVYSIGGSLRDDVSHRSLENVLVTLKQLTGATVNTAFTRSNGDFQFDGLSDGDYILEINAKEYDRVHETI